jgi:nitrite reductase/ring-hydroxylating ferredoxin subunit
MTPYGPRAVRPRCIVASLEHHVIECPCHGSRFSVTGGSVLRRPAVIRCSRAAQTIARYTMHTCHKTFLSEPAEELPLHDHRIARADRVEVPRGIIRTEVDAAVTNVRVALRGD